MIFTMLDASNQLSLNSTCFVEMRMLTSLSFNILPCSAPTKLHTVTPTTAAPSTTPSNNPSANIQESYPFSKTYPPSQEQYSQAPTTIPAHHAGNDDAEIPERKDPLSKGTIAGVSSAVALAIIAVCMISHNVYRNSCKNSRSLNEEYFSKDANHFGTLLQPWEGPLPLAYDMSSNRSLVSSSSSFRDFRFVNVYGPDGSSISQFNPNTAGAVVIGSVTIGASSSTCSSHYAKHGESFSSAKSRSFFSVGQGSRQVQLTKQKMAGSDVESGISSKDDVSSLSSNRSYLRGNWARQRRFKKSSQNCSFNGSRTTILVGASQSIGSQSAISRSTMPMASSKGKKFERRAVNFDRQVSFADWKAVSFMTNEYRHPEQATDSAAAMKQKRFFFDLFASNMSDSSSDVAPKGSSCKSLAIAPRVAKGSLSDAGASSFRCKLTLFYSRVC